MAADDLLTFKQLSEEQRGIAWAVVRSLATSLWVGVVAMSTAWVFLAAYDDAGFSLWSLVPLVGVAGLAVGMEVKSRDLDKPR